MQWHSVSDSKMQLQKRFVTESDKKAVVDSKTRERVSSRSKNIFLVTKYRSSQCQVKL